MKTQIDFGKVVSLAKPRKLGLISATLCASLFLFSGSFSTQVVASEPAMKVFEHNQGAQNAHLVKHKRKHHKKRHKKISHRDDDSSDSSDDVVRCPQHGAPMTNITLQQCVDATPNGGVLLLKGGEWDFHTTLAPVRINKSITIKSKRKSDPAILVGSEDDLTFDGTNGERLINNSAFEMFDQDTNIKGVTVKDIEFKHFAHAIFFVPEASEQMLAENTDDYYCESVGTGLVRNVKIMNNTFEGNRRNIVVHGGNLEGVQIKGNRINNAIGDPIIMNGFVINCSYVGGYTPSVGFGYPKGVVIKNNRMYNSSNAGYEIRTDSVPGVLVKGNEILNSHKSGGILVSIDHNPDPTNTTRVDVGQIIGNTVDSALWVPIYDDEGNRIGFSERGNAISIEIANAYGAEEEILTKNGTICNNTTRGTRWVDIWLSGYAGDIIVTGNDVDPLTQNGRWGYEGFGGNILVGDLPFFTDIEPEDNILYIRDEDTLLDFGFNTVVNRSPLADHPDCDDDSSSSDSSSD